MFEQLFKFIDYVPSPWNEIMKIVLVIVGVFALFKTTIRSIPQDEWAMRTFFGKVIKKRKTGLPIFVGPGFHFALPWAYGFVTVNVLDHTIRFGPSQVKYSDFVVARFSATATFAVSNIYAIRYHVQELEERVSSACAAYLRSILRLVPGNDVDGFKELIAAMFAVETDWMIEALGIELKALDITDFEYDSQFAIAGSQAAIAAAIRSIGPQLAPLLGGVGESPKN